MDTVYINIFSLILFQVSHGNHVCEEDIYCSPNGDTHTISFPCKMILMSKHVKQKK